MRSCYQKWLLISLCLGLIFSGCSSSTPTKADARTDKFDSTTDLSIEQLVELNQTLKKENELLSHRLKNLERQQDSDRVGQAEDMRAMKKTMSLLELNLKEVKSIVTNLSATKSNTVKRSERSETQNKLHPDKPKALSSTSAGFIREMRIPDNSKAVETISLLPSSSFQSQSKKIKQKKSPRKPHLKTVLKKPKNQTKTEKRELQWEDPDLNTPVSPIPLNVVAGAKKQYQKSFKVFSTRNYKEAIEQFNNFLLRFPNDQDADNSQFWIGQAYYSSGNYLKAENAFRKVLKNYNHGDTKHGFKTPDAILMLGRIYQIRNKPIKAMRYFQQVLTRFPDSRSALKAQIEIQTFNSFKK